MVLVEDNYHDFFKNAKIFLKISTTIIKHFIIFLKSVIKFIANKKIPCMCKEFLIIAFIYFIIIIPCTVQGIFLL